MVAITNTTWMDSICATWEKGFIEINTFNLCKWTLCIATKLLALYLILKIHLQLINFELRGKGVSKSYYLVKIKTQNPWPFSNIVNLYHSKPPQRMGFININKKNTWKIHIFFQPLHLIFLHLLRIFFIMHLWFLI